MADPSGWGNGPGRWITVASGAHVWIRDGGSVAESRHELTGIKAAPKLQAAVARARASGVVPDYRGKRTDAEKTAIGHSMAYKDVSNYVAGPKHTRGDVVKRLAKGNRGEAASSPFYQGYTAGARRAGDDWLSHIDKATGGKRTRTSRRLSKLMDQV
jgi:hypothetical protein